MTAVERAAGRHAPRSPWRSVALPSEHGGWGLTLEPGLLGLVALVLAAAAVGLDRRLAAGAVATGAVIAAQRFAATQPVPRPMVLGLRQMAMGLGVVLATSIGVLATAS